MTETVPSFTYTALAPGEIRLLILGRGLCSDPVWCIIIHRQLSEASYQALSYEWGIESKEDPDVIVNGRAVRVRKNLHEALKQIRQAEEEIYLWVDALCIHQAHPEEKSQQIGLMGKIFGNASCVIAWLGIARDDSDIAMDWMAKKNELEEDLQCSTWGGPERKAIELLYYRPYWRRVWIIQELYFARIHMVRCGTKIISRDQFENSLAILNRFESDWKEITGNPADHHRRSRMRRRDFPSGMKYNKLHAWLKVCIKAGFESSNEHDMIYALLGISDDFQNGEITVDYNKPLLDLYLETISIYPSSWRYYSPEKYLLPMAKKMKLKLDENLRCSIKEIVDDEYFKFADGDTWGKVEPKNEVEKVN
ncbi:heterokaryon incompatibility protein-domain-containing protein [Tricladium varicosporioides]|nr:heterokaryon incompatibility protein-domain-containing protein [Hymenoscyphus varicosporioides]